MRRYIKYGKLQYFYRKKRLYPQKSRIYVKNGVSILSVCSSLLACNTFVSAAKTSSQKSIGDITIVANYSVGYS